MLPASSAWACPLESRCTVQDDPAARRTSPRSTHALQSPPLYGSLSPPAMLRVNSRFPPRLKSTRLLFLCIVGLGPFLDSQQLVFPQPLERARPFVQRPDRHSIHFVKHLPTVSPDLHQANTFQNFQVL